MTNRRHFAPHRHTSPPRQQSTDTGIPVPSTHACAPGEHALQAARRKVDGAMGQQDAYLDGMDARVLPRHGTSCVLVFCLGMLANMPHAKPSMPSLSALMLALMLALRPDQSPYPQGRTCTPLRIPSRPPPEQPLPLPPVPPLAIHCPQ